MEKEIAIKVVEVILETVLKITKIALEAKEMNEFRHQIYQPCKEVLDCRLVAKRISKLFQ